MKKPWKKGLSVLMTLSIVFSVLPVTALAAENEEVTANTVIELEESHGAPYSLRSFEIAALSEAGTVNVNGVYQIQTADELIWFANQVNTGDGTAFDAVLLNDIDMSGVTDWTPIGSGQYNYTGTFDGGGNSIKNWKLSATNTQFVGLFGKVTGTIKNLTIDESCSVDVNISDSFGSNIWIASMICVTRAGSVIENCHNEADYTVNAVGATAKSAIAAYVGGVLGQHSGEAVDCSNSGTISCAVQSAENQSGTVYMGGVIARNYNGELVCGCSNSGKVIANVKSGKRNMSVYTAGVVGFNSGNVVECENDGTVELNGSCNGTIGHSNISGFYVGGIIGKDSSSTVSECKNKGDVSVNISDKYQEKLVISSGGVIGEKVGGAVKDCVNLSEVKGDISAGSAINASRNTGVAPPVCVGGIVGMMENATIECCVGDNLTELKLYNETSGTLGGIVGLDYSSCFIDCENKGNINGISGGSKFYVGGIVGKHHNEEQINDRGESVGYDAIVEGGRNFGEITVKGSATVGGIVGYNYTYRFDSDRRYSYIINSQNVGSVVAFDATVGGVAGDNKGFIYNSCNNGNLNGNIVGGIAANCGSDASPKIENCYSSGIIVAKKSEGGLTAVGRRDVTSYSYWLDSSGMTIIPVYLSFCDSFGSSQKVSYEDGIEEIDLLQALNQRAAVHADDALLWCSWRMGDKGYPELGDLQLGTKEEVMYQSADGSWITANFAAALANAPEGSTVKLLKDVVLSDYIVITKDVTITSADVNDPKMITNLTEKHLSLLRIRSGEVTLQDIILDGGRENDISSMEALIVIEGYANLYLEDGAELRNNLNQGYSQDTLLAKMGGAINAFAKSSVYMNGGRIYNTSNCHGSIILNNGAQLILNDGEIRKNTSAAGFGAAVYIYNGSFIMNGGSLEENNAKGEGGAVYILDASGSFTMNDGSISGNVSQRKGGGAVYLNGGTFTMNGGSITGNSAPNGSGGGIFQIQAGLYSDGTVGGNSFVYLNNGIISGNSAKIGGGMAIHGYSSLLWNGVGTWGNTVISNVKITGNTASVRAGGIDINPGNILQMRDFVQISGNICTNDEKLSDVSLCNTTEYIEPAGIMVISGELVNGSKICVDTLFKESDPSQVKALVAKGTDTYTITENDFRKFVSTNPDYDLILEDNAIYLVARIPAEGIELSSDELSLKVGETGTLTATLEPDNATVPITWTSSNPSIAMVDNGVVTALKEGSVTITATVPGKNGDEISASCAVTVTAADTGSEDPPDDPGNTGGTGSSSNSGSRKYRVNVEEPEFGEVESSHNTARRGKTITLTITPDAEFDLETLKVVDRNGNEIELTENDDGTFSFKMPRSDVWVTADFAEADTADERKVIILTIDERLAWVFGEPVMNDVPPVIRNERTMLPIRFVVENLGGEVIWDEPQQKVIIVKEGKVIEIIIGHPYAYINGHPIELDSPAFIENDRTYLPLRFVAENLGATVIWDEPTRTVTIIP